MLCNIQYTSGNQSLKGPAIGSDDKYTTLLLLAWSNKPVFQLLSFSYKAKFAEFSLVSNFFQSNFLLLSNEKSRFV